MCIGTQRRPAPASVRRPIDTSLLQRVVAKNNFPPAPQAYEIPSFPLVSAPAPKPPQRKKHAHIIVQHHYHDHANDNPADYQEEHPARGGVTTPFPLKLHEMLENIAADGYDDVISWQPHGRCFVVHKPKEFVELLPRYFKLSKLASFQRQLNLYGFQRLTRGRDRGGYYHELFLRDRVFLAHNIQRIKVKGTGVRARSNPDQEPDFWQMPFVGSFAGTPPLRSEPTFSQQVIDKAIAQLPLKLTPPVPKPLPNPFMEENSDILCNAFERRFHYLDPFQPANGSWTISGVDELLSSEAESFFEDFEFPENIGAEIEDDDVFGDMLEQMIA